MGNEISCCSGRPSKRRGSSSSSSEQRIDRSSTYEIKESNRTIEIKQEESQKEYKERNITQLPLSSDEEEETTTATSSPPPQPPPTTTKYPPPRDALPQLSKEEKARRASAILFIMSHLTEDLTAKTTTKTKPALKRSVSAVAIRKYCFSRFQPLFRCWIAKSRARQTRIKKLHEELRDSEKQFSQGLLFIETQVVKKLRDDKILSVRR